MNFKDMLETLSMLSEATKETEKGRVHKAEPGGYGRQYDTDEEGDEDGDKDAKKPTEKRGRGRPAKTGAHASSPEEKKKQKGREEAGKALQSMIGTAPKKSKELEKLPKKKHSLKEFFDQIDQERLIQEATPGQALQVKPMAGAAQLVDPASGKVVATGKADKINAMQRSMAQGEVQMPKMEEAEGKKWIQKAIDPSKKGALRKKLGAKEGEPIPAGKLEKATHSKDPTTARQARLAQTLRKINKESINEGLAEGLEPELGGTQRKVNDLFHDSNLENYKALQAFVQTFGNQYEKFKQGIQQGYWTAEYQQGSLSMGDAPGYTVTVKNPMYYKTFLGLMSRLPNYERNRVHVFENLDEARLGTPKSYDPKVFKNKGAKHLLDDPKLMSYNQLRIYEIPDKWSHLPALKKLEQEDGKKWAFKRFPGDAAMRDPYTFGVIVTKPQYYKEFLSLISSINPGLPVMVDTREKPQVGDGSYDPKGVELINYIKEVEQPTEDNMKAMGANLAAGRNPYSLEEAKKTVKRDDKAEKAGRKVAKDIEYDEKVKDKIHGTKRHSEDEKAERAGKKVAKDIEYDEKKNNKKKVNESMHRHSSARLMGKAHALAKEAYNCRYEDMEEAKAYHDGFKEGLDECYGQGVYETAPAMPPSTMSGMAHAAMEDDLDEMDKTSYMKQQAIKTKGPTFKAFGQTMYDKDVLENSLAFESLDKQLHDLLIEGEVVEEGMSVSISKGNQGAPDSVTVSAQDSEAEKLLSFIKQTGLGLFGDESQSNYGAPTGETPKHAHGDIEVVDDHDGMMSIMKKLSGMDQDNDEDYRDEEHHEHEDECNECGYMESDCQCDEEALVDETESYGQEEEKVAEANPDDSDEAETSADENAEAEEDEALARADELKEWANQVGKGPGKGTDASFEEDIEFMTKIIAGGLNKPKATGQTTIPVIPGQGARTGHEDISAWKKLAGI